MTNVLETPRFRTSTIDHDDLDDALAAFRQLRPRLLDIAYRIVGRWADPEAVVPDAWVRWHTIDRSVVPNPTAFLVTTTTRLALNAATSARARRETSVGDRLPEPLEAGDLPAAEAERNVTLQQGL